MMTILQRGVSLLLFSSMICMLATAAGRAATAEDDPAANANANARAEAWLKEMTLDEKIGQMTQADLAAIKDLSDIATLAFGSVLSGGNSDPADITPQGWARTHDEVQSWALKSRLKIPIIYGIDAVHGHNNVKGAVIFPHNIGLGASRDPALAEKAARITALEMIGTGVRWAFAPCVAVARDERWGRTYESFGETPDLAVQMGPAAMHGLQGASLADPNAVLACVKHYVGDGGTTGGIDQGNNQTDEQTLRKIHLPGYVAAIQQGALSIMASYNSWNGIKLHGHRYLLTDVLKNELGFDGFVVSDWAAIDQLSDDYKKAIEQSINAGVDMVMIPNGDGQKNNYREFIQLLKQLVQEGKVPEARIDDAARRILRVKARMNLADHPFSDPELTKAVGSAEHRQAARECVQKSLVLLKNEKNALPLSKKLKRIVVAGPAADDLGMQCGGWTISWQGETGNVTPGGTTILKAVRNAVDSATEVFHSPDGNGIQNAAAVVVVIGEPPYAEMKGDRKDLSLPPESLAVVKKAREAKVPVITVLFSGRPVLIDSVLADSDAVIAAWLPGTEGQGVTDVLFGNVKPAGKLPHTWPRSMDQIPTNVDDQTANDPLFPFGFGLSY